MLLLTTSALGQVSPAWTIEELGHSDWITAETFSPDGMYYVTGSDDKTILIRVADTGQEVYRLTGHSGTINSLSFSPNGSMIASASSDESIRFWSPSTGLEIGRITGHSAEVTSVEFSPDGTQLVSASADTTIRLWNVNDQQEIARLTGHSGAVTSVSFNSNGRYLASGSADKTMRLWNVAARETVITFSGHGDVVTSVAFSPSSRLPLIASGSNDQTIRLWSPNTGQEIIDQPIPYHEGLIKDIVFSSNGRRMISVSENRVFMFTQFGLTGTINLRILMLTGGGPFGSASMSPDGQLMTFGGGNELGNGLKVGTSYLLQRSEIENNRIPRIERYIAPTLLTYSVAFSTDGSQFVSGSWDGTLRLSSTDSGDVVRRFNTGSPAAILAVAISPDGTRIASGSYDQANSLRIWDTNSLMVLDSLSRNSRFNSVDFSPSGNQLATGSDDGLVQLWDAESGKVDVELSGHTSSINSVVFSADGNLLASGSDDHTVRLWDLDNQNLLRTLSDGPFGVSSVVFSPSGDLLVSGYHDGNIRVWDVASGQVMRQITGHQERVTSVEISQDGNEIVSGSFDHTVRVWSLSTGEELRKFDHEREVYSVDMSNDQQFILSAGINTVKLWDQNDLLEFTSGVENQTYVMGRNISPLTLPEVVGGITPVNYSLAPSLPDGLLFDASSRQLTGTPSSVTPPQIFTYTATDSRGLTGQLNFSIGVIAPVSNERQDLPEAFSIVGNYPNPFNESTNLLLNLPESMIIHLEVVDVIGRRMLTLPATKLHGGWRRSINIRGNSLPAGIYLYRLTASSSSGTSVHTGQFIRVR